MPASPLNTDDFGGELFQLAMSEDARPLLEKVKTFIREEVTPMAIKFHELDSTMVDEWTYTDEQLALLEGVKDKAKANGLWNFFLPDSDVGGLSNLDYAYIATELGKERLASECLNCAAPDTGNMEVLERVGYPRAERAVAQATSQRRDPFCVLHDRTRRCILRRQERSLRGATRWRRVRDQRREVLRIGSRRSSLQDPDRYGSNQP